MNFEKRLEIFTNNDSWYYSFRYPKTLNEMKENSSVEHSRYVRAKRRVNNLPNSWDDNIKCYDRDTRRQIRRSQNNFRDTIRNIIVEESD